MTSQERQLLLSRTADQLGVNRIVLALSVARLADAVGNSILFIIIPLYVTQLPAPWFWRFLNCHSYLKIINFCF